MIEREASVTAYPARLEALTSIRFLMALGVVLFHFQLVWAFPEGSSGLLNRARLGVDAFFILSGFVLAHVYLQPGAPFSYRRFLAARFARIYPAHLFVLLGVLSMVATAGLLGIELQPGRFNVPDFFQTLLLIQAWFPRHDQVFWNGPSWSLSAEWFAYLAFPVFALVATALRRRPLILIGLSLVLFSLLDAFYQAVFGLILPRAEDSMGFFRIIPEFLFGIGLYFFGVRVSIGRGPAIAFALLSGAALLYAMQIGADDRLIVFLCGPFILACSFLSKTGAEGVLGHRWLVFMGDCSYALYLVHLPLLLAWRNVAAKLLGLPDDYLMGLPEQAVVLTVTLIAAVAIYCLVERPARPWIRSVLNTDRLARTAD
ncbi:MAG: acyltransferase [Caulobacterales bacterium]|nr:acyltransferase [Caulobacterales bacterium]